MAELRNAVDVMAVPEGNSRKRRGVFLENLALFGGGGALEYMAVVTRAEFVATERGSPRSVRTFTATSHIYRNRLGPCRVTNHVDFVSSHL